MSVKDDGIGIREEDQTKLFSEFGKIISNENNSLNAQGVGLGLQISQELAVLLGPKNNEGIQIYSKYGYGSEFYFFIQNHANVDSKEDISDSDCSQKLIQ